jgi:small-conductance mechanosensitive channel
MSIFGGVLLFFHDLGLYDVVLPFLLVFTIVYALLEKTKILGVEKVGEKEFTKRNIDSMAAFVIAFFVIASTQLVAIISEVTANMVLLLILLVCFMLLVGTMHKEEEKGFELKGFYKHAFYVIMFVGIILIFLNALGWLQLAWDYLVLNWDSQFVGIIVLLGSIIGLMAFVMHTPKEAKEEKKA